METPTYLNRITTFDDTSGASEHSAVLSAYLGRYRSPGVPQRVARTLAEYTYPALTNDVRVVVTDDKLGDVEPESPMDTFIRDSVTLAAPNTAYAAKLLMAQVSRYVLWCTRQGWPLDPTVIWSVRAIDIYSTTANQDRAEGTRRNYRSILMRVSEVLVPDEHPERPTPLSTRETAAPYAAWEMERFRTWAGSQLTDLKRDRAMLMLVLCAGAGIRPGELPFLRHNQVLVDDAGVLITVADRQVPLLAEWEEWMLVLLDRRPTDQALWGPINRRNTSNLTSNFTEKSFGHPPRADRLRHTWFTHHLTVGVPMKDLLRAAGVGKLQQLHLLLEYVALRDDAEYRRIFRSEVQG